MIDETDVRRIARELGVRTDYAEKNYVNSWVLYGVYESSFGDGLLFKGGTALSKLYFPETWRYSEDLDFTVHGQYTGSRSELRDALDTVERLSGIRFEITDYYESRERTYPAHYVEASVQYEAMFDHRNTTELNVMVDEVVADDPVTHTHSYEDVDSFSLSAYSLAEILGEKLRALYQRARGRDYYDLYRIISGDDAPAPEVVAPVFEEKRKHAPDESYHSSPNPADGVPSSRRATIADDWETTLPELTSELPPFERVEATVDTYLKRKIAAVV